MKVIKPDIRIHFEELCYMSKLTNQEVKKYFTFLKTRIQDIEETIDTHFNMIQKAIKQDKVDKLERQMKLKDKEDEEKEKEIKKFKGQNLQLISNRSKSIKTNRTIRSKRTLFSNDEK